MILDCCSTDKDFRFYKVHRELFPSYRLEPTNTSAFARSENWSAKSNYVQESFQRRFRNSIDFSKFNVYWFSSSRQFLRTYFDSAVKKSISGLKIANYSNSRYLTSCISEIFPNFSLNRSKDNNHLFICDFGYAGLAVSNEVIDDAWSFDLVRASEHLANGCKVYVTSLTKSFGMPFGSMAIAHKSEILQSDLLEHQRLFLMREIDEMYLEYEQVSKRRRDTLETLLHGLHEIGSNYFGFVPKFPGAAVIKLMSNFDEVAFKKLLNLHGIRGTSYFGNQAIVIPCHQSLDESDANIMIEIIKHIHRYSIM